MDLFAPVWADLAQSFSETPPLVAAMRMLAALFLGGAIGFEREWHRKPAGLRTNMLVALASALFALITLELVGISRAEGAASGARSDIVRLIVAVTSGVAFLAAGSIVMAQGKISGLTTGAGLWLSGAVGLACGTGRVGLAAMATLFAVIVLWIFKGVEQRFDSLENRFRHPATLPPRKAVRTSQPPPTRKS